MDRGSVVLGRPRNPELPGWKYADIACWTGDEVSSRSMWPNILHLADWMILLSGLEPVRLYSASLRIILSGYCVLIRLMDQSVDSALFFFPFFLVLNCTLNSLDFFVFCISLSLYFPLALSLRMSFLFYGSLSEGYIPALCRLMPTRTSKIIIIIIIPHGMLFQFCFWSLFLQIASRNENRVSARFCAQSTEFGKKPRKSRPFTPLA